MIIIKLLNKTLSPYQQADNLNCENPWLFSLFCYYDDVPLSFCHPLLVDGGTTDKLPNLC